LPCASLREYWPAEVLSQDEHESLVRITFPGSEIALFQAMAWSDVATIVEPAELHTAILARVQSALERYAALR
jgi:hypothetical protein